MPTLQASLRLTFSNILVPTDFTGASENALAYARAFAKDYGSRIFVTHAVAPNPPIFLPMEPVPPDLDGEWADAQSELDKFLRSEPRTDILQEGILERGELWNVLDDVIHRHSIDLIVLGSHGRHGLKKLVLGSGAEQIFRKAQCPVLTLGPKVPEPKGDVAVFKHIIFATDFSSGSLKALPYALSLAEEHEASLTLLHVVPLVPMQHQMYVSGGAEKRLEDLIPPDAKDWCRPSAVVSFEFPAEGILHLAETQSADLIVMGVHKRAPRAAAHLPWAIAYEVVCHDRAGLSEGSCRLSRVLSLREFTANPSGFGQAVRRGSTYGGVQRFLTAPAPSQAGQVTITGVAPASCRQQSRRDAGATRSFLRMASTCSGSPADLPGRAHAPSRTRPSSD
jgi:nucleotide-binding universal stress UspA family protein